MPIINFKPEFAELVASGKKRQTIRKIRKRPFKVGDKLYLYTGLRTKGVRNLIIASMADGFDFPIRYYVKCKEVHDIEILEYYGFGGDYVVSLDNGKPLTCNQADAIAIHDGFETAEEMCDWFKKTHGLPFYGQLVRW